MFQFIIFLLFSLGLALTANEKRWEEWKKETYSKELSSPTSFLNAISLNQALSGQSLYLVVHKNLSETRWVKVKPKNYYAQAEHIGDKIRISMNGQTFTYLSQDPKKRRKSFKLSNGAIAEVVLGKRVNKMWTYLYNPQQIKKFTGFRFFPYNDQAVVKGTFKKTPPKKIGYKTVQGDPTEVSKLGNVSFILNGKETFLSAYNWQKKGEIPRYLALIFVDKTSGKETYGGGRELVIRFESPPRDGESFTLDFNQTMNFYCAHSPFWHCPVGLQEPIKTSVRAGEMLPLKKIVSQ